MKNSIISVLVSLAVHALLAGGLVAYLAYAPAPDVVATLDLTSVELSFAEKVEETAAVAPMPSAPPPEPHKPQAAEKPPEQKVEKLQAPDPLAPKFPEPKEEIPEIETPAVPERPEPSEPSEAPKPSEPARPPAPAAPQQARVDAPPSPKRTIRPDYPKGARQRGEQGAVILEIHVDADGAVSEAKVVTSSGFAELDEAAVRAALKAKFRPAKSGDKAVASTARLKLEFKLK